MNVPDLGWVGGPYRLIARLDAALPGFEWWLADIIGNGVAAAILSRPVGSPAMPQFLLTFGVTGNFPYGLAVEPDH